MRNVFILKRLNYINKITSEERVCSIFLHQRRQKTRYKVALEKGYLLYKNENNLQNSHILMF